MEYSYNTEMLIARKKANLTQKQLAGMVKKSAIWISRIEQGKEKASKELAKAISEALKSDPEKLFPGTFEGK